MGSRSGRVAVLALSSALLGAPGCSGEPSAEAQAGGGPKPREAVPVVVARPVLATIEDSFLEREATLLPIVTTKVSAQQEGLITRIYPEVGDVVHEGDTIVEMRDVDYRLRLAERKAELTKARVTLAERERSFARAEELYRKEIISEDERDDRELQLENARAEVELARARAERAEQDLAALRIVAPFPAVVASIDSEVGSYVQRGDPILELKRVDWIVALCTVSERDLQDVREGGSVWVALPAYPGRAFEGLIWKIVPDAVVASRSFPVKVLLQNPGIELKSGMSARIGFVRRVENALLVPKDAVVREGERSVVWVARDGRAERREVELGAAVSDRWHVRKGLGADEEVIVTGNESLQPEDRIQIAELPPRGSPASSEPRSAEPKAGS